MDGVAHDWTYRRSFTEPRYNYVGGMKRRFYIYAGRVAEVVEADYILCGCRLVDDRVGPDTMFVKMPRDGYLSCAIHSFVYKGHPVRFDTMLAGPARCALTARWISAGSDNHSRLKLATDDEAIAGVAEAKRILGLCIFPGVVLAFDAYQSVV